MKRVKTGFSGFLLIVLLLIPEGPAQSQAAKGSQLFATYTAPAASMAQMWIAREVGYFSQRGLDVKLIYIPGGPIGTTDKLGFRTIVDITALRIPFAAAVLVSTGATINRKTDLLKRFMRGYAEAVHTFLTDPEFTAKVISKYAKIEDREIINYSIRAEAVAMERSLDFDKSGMELILNYLKKTFPRQLLPTSRVY